MFNEIKESHEKFNKIVSHTETHTSYFPQLFAVVKKISRSN